MHNMKTTSHYIASKVKYSFNKQHMAVTFEGVHVRTLPIYEYYMVATIFITILCALSP